MNIPTGTIDENGNIDGRPFADWFADAENTIAGASAYQWDRDRPYNGQAHTNFGERGRTEVKGLTFRDVMDCFIAGLLNCCATDQPELYELADKALWNDLYKVDLNNIDPGAWWQNMSCCMEKMMGIYPNVPNLHIIEESK